MPSRLDDISWSWQQSCGGSTMEVADRDGVNVWDDSTLSGVWYRSVPEFALPAGLDEADQRYILEEVVSSFTMAWPRCRCPFVGIAPTLNSPLVDAGPETRTELRRLGVSTPNDWVGLFGDIVEKFRAVQRDVWITASRRSGWLADLLGSGDPGCCDELSDEIVIASLSRKQRRFAAIFINSELILVSLRNRRAMSVPPDEVINSVKLVREATHLRVGVCYFVHDPRWLIVRISPHIPNWLDAKSNEWVAVRLCSLFQTSSYPQLVPLPHA